MTVDPFPTDFDVPFGAVGDKRSLLVVADDAQHDDANALAQAAGARLLGIVALDQAPARIESDASCDIIMVFCPHPSEPLERLIVQLETFAMRNGTAIILLAGIETVDLAYACLRNLRTQLLCNPDRTDIAAALLAAVNSDPTSQSLHDISGKNDGIRLQELSEEVGRLARTIEALTQRPLSEAPRFDVGTRMADRASNFIGMPVLSPIGCDAPQGDMQPVTAAYVRDLLRVRRIRANFLPGDLFADPAWDILLDLLAARLEQDRVSVSSLCIAAAVPPTTALRWIRTLTDKGLVERQADPQDGRRIFIALAQEAFDGLLRWFSATRRYFPT